MPITDAGWNLCRCQRFVRTAVHQLSTLFSTYSHYVITMEIFILLIRCMVDILQNYSLGIEPWPIGVNMGGAPKTGKCTPPQKNSTYE